MKMLGDLQDLKKKSLGDLQSLKSRLKNDLETVQAEGLCPHLGLSRREDQCHPRDPHTAEGSSSIKWYVDANANSSFCQ